ncbi:MAG: hypothetical protein AAGH57_14075 [Pseudomonadota bacterium]
MSSSQFPKAACKTAPAFVPALVPTATFAVAIALLGAFTPVPLNAHPHPYVNTQFVEENAGRHQSGQLVIRNTSILPRTVYARFEIPSEAPSEAMDGRANRNNGFVQTVPPLSKIIYALPIGVRVFACDGKYWDDYRPDEAYAVTISAAQTYTFTAREFKPSALRRARSRAKGE